MATDLMIGIGAEYKGKPAFDKASKQVTGLEKSVSKLGKTFLGVFAAQKLYALGKASVNAYTQDNKAALQLTQTLKNLGLAFEDTRVKNFIADMEKTYKVADDLLRPAFQNLLNTTGSVAKSQSMLQTALNVSAGSGTDLATVVQDLSQAYVGNLKGLKKYDTGLTNAELATKSFAQIQEQLNKQFAGQAAISAAADPMNALALAANNAKEVIGKGLVDALSKATAGAGDINTLTDSIDKLAKSTAGFLNFVGFTVGGIVKGFKEIGSWFAPIDSFLKKIGVLKQDSLTMPKGSLPKGGGKTLDLNTAARAKAEAAANKRAKELALLTQKTAIAAAETARQKKLAAAIDASNKIFNMDLIQNVAALQGKLTDDEVKRLTLQQDLLLGNADAAAKLAQELLATQRATLEIRNSDPFLGWTKGAQAALDTIKQIQTDLAKLGTPVASAPAWSALTADALAAVADASNIEYDKALQDTAALVGAQSTANPYSWFTGSPAYNPMNGNANVNVNLNVATDGTQIVTYTNAASANGTAVTLNRLNSNFG